VKLAAAMSFLQFLQNFMSQAEAIEHTSTGSSMPSILRVANKPEMF
jgi:hypothetical protein